MKKNCLVLILLNICTLSIFCDQYSQYKFEKVAMIPVGYNKGMIGWQTPVAGGPSSPLTFLATKNRYFIPDVVNTRLNIYDKNGRFLKEINDNKKLIHVSSLLLIDNGKNIFGLVVKYGFIKVDTNNNETIYFIDWDKLPKALTERNELFIANDEIFFYYDNHEVGTISKKGLLESMDRAVEKLYNLQPGIRKENEEIEKELLRNKIIIGENYYTSSISKFKAFINNQKEDKYKKIGDILSKQNISVDLRNYFIEFIGYDDDHNSYWTAEQNTGYKGVANYCIIIFSKYGEFLDAIIYGQSIYNENTAIIPNVVKFPTSWSRVVVDGNGDLYFLCGPKIDYAINENDKLPSIDLNYYHNQKQKPSYIIYKVKCIWKK